MKTKYTFPKGFEWGAAASAYQIEGACNEDGRGESIWDRFCHQPGNILRGETGDIACDHYHRYEKDVEIMKNMGLKTYRFSISWPRIFPKGFGKPNKKGLNFYKRLIDKLLEADIKPTVALYHFDLPQALQENGGWANRKTVKYYEEYAKFVFKELGNSVSKWITHNEPYAAAYCGHASGKHAPGIQNMKIAIQVAHNILLSHGRAVVAYKEMNLDGDIGVTLSLRPIYPNSKEDAYAAEMRDQFKNRWVLDPILKGFYPKEMLKIFRDRWGVPIIKKGDMEIINEPIDFLGTCYYHRNLVITDESNIFGFKKIKPKDSEYTATNWEIYPQGLYDLLVKIKKDYGNISLYITENGAAFDDKLEKDGVHDEQRINYLQEHIKKAHEVLKAGVKLKGYSIWSLMDNFEWAFGYSKRFGLIYVNYKTQERVWKDSAYFYKSVIKNNGIV